VKHNHDVVSNMKSSIIEHLTSQRKAQLVVVKEIICMLTSSSSIASSLGVLQDCWVWIKATFKNPYKSEYNWIPWRMISRLQERGLGLDILTPCHNPWKILLCNFGLNKQQFFQIGRMWWDIELLSRCMKSMQCTICKFHKYVPTSFWIYYYYIYPKSIGLHKPK
jgi:hypothetical protein